MSIRLIAWGLAVQSGHVLVQSDIAGDLYRLPGGGMEDGELAAEAIARELREEYDLEVQVGPLCTTFESLFEDNGTTHHQVVLIHHMSAPRTVGQLRHREHDDIVIDWVALASLASRRTAPPDLARFATQPPTHLVAFP